MTTLAIMATYEKKRLKCYGTVAAGEHVAVTVTDGAQWIGEGKALRLRVLFGPDTVGVFPFADGDAWTATGTQNADAHCELNLNTLQAEKYLKHGGTCLWILDDVENHTLYATGEFDVLPWPKRRGIDEPIDLDGYPLLLDEIKDLKEAFEEYQRTVAQAFAAKQDTIFDLATIRSGAAAGATAVQPAQIARFVDDAEYKAQYGEQNKPAILFKHGTNVIVALDATPFVKDGMVSSVEVVGGNLVITFNTDAGLEPIEIPLTDIFDPDNYYNKGAVDALLNDKQDALTFDNAPTSGSNNPVKSGGIWSAIWGALSALPTGFSSLYDWCVAQLAGKASKSDVDSLLFARYYPEGSVKSAAEFTPGIKYDAPNTTNRTITVKPFCNTGTADDNSNLEGRVVIPPFVDAHGNGYISDDGTRYKVVGVSGFDGRLFANTNLTAVIAPNTVTTISGSALAYCTALSSVALPAAAAIGDFVFASSAALTSVDFGDMPRSSVPTLGNSAFAGVPSSCKIIVPYSQYDAWIAAAVWSGLPQEFVRHPEKADKPATFTAGNLAKFDAQGNPTDSGKKPSDFQSALTQTQLDNIAAVPNKANNADVVHKTGAETIAGSKTFTSGIIVTTGSQQVMYSSGIFVSGGATMSFPAESGTLALASAIPYSLVTKTISNGAVSLDDRASNAVTISTTLSPNTLTINFPTATSGEVRDFAMRLNIAAGVTAPEIAWPQGVTLENDGGEVPEIADGGTGGSSTILYFSETENDGTTAKFLVKGETLTAIAQA